MNTFSNIIFLAEPDRYGRFGHQSFSQLTAWSLAHRLKAAFIPIGYRFFAEQHNSHVNYSKSSRAVLQLPGSTYHRLVGAENDKHGNTKYDLWNSCQVATFFLELNDIASLPGSHIVHLPFDQTPGPFIFSMNCDMHGDLRSIFQIATHKNIGAPRVVRIGIHIRRGDVTPEAHPDWFISDSYYRNLIRALYELYGEKISVSIFTQGVLSFLSDKGLGDFYARGNLVVYSSAGAWTNAEEVGHFRSLAGCDIVVSGQSSFSQLASLITSGMIQVAVVKNRDSRFPHILSGRHVIYADSHLCTMSTARMLVKEVFSDLIKKTGI